MGLCRKGTPNAKIFSLQAVCEEATLPEPHMHTHTIKTQMPTKEPELLRGQRDWHWGLEEGSHCPTQTATGQNRGAQRGSGELQKQETAEQEKLAWTKTDYYFSHIKL